MGNLNKFEKNRSVDKNWIQVPWLYLLNEKGSNIGKKWYNKKKKVVLSYDEAKEKFEEWFPTKKYTLEMYNRDKESGMRYMYKDIKIPGESDKTLAIIQLFGTKGALCAWRNEDSCKMGMARMYPVRVIKGELFLIYKGRKISISKQKHGWVL